MYSGKRPVFSLQPHKTSWAEIETSARLLPFPFRGVRLRKKDETKQRWMRISVRAAWFQRLAQRSNWNVSSAGPRLGVGRTEIIQKTDCSSSYSLGLGDKMSPLRLITAWRLYHWLLRSETDSPERAKVVMPISFPPLLLCCSAASSCDWGKSRSEPEVIGGWGGGSKGWKCNWRNSLAILWLQQHQSL